MSTSFGNTLVTTIVQDYDYRVSSPYEMVVLIFKKNGNSNPLSDIKVTRYESFVVHPINVELCPWEPEE